MEMRPDFCASYLLDMTVAVVVRRLRHGAEVAGARCTAHRWEPYFAVLTATTSSCDWPAPRSASVSTCGAPAVFPSDHCATVSIIGEATGCRMLPKCVVFEQQVEFLLRQGATALTGFELGYYIVH
jgi:hypothetical protein